MATDFGIGCDAKPIYPGDAVRIAYYGYTVEAVVIAITGYGWLLVEQTSDYPDPAERPRYEALASLSEKIDA